MKEKITRFFHKLPLAILSALLMFSLTTVEARAEVTAEQAAAAIAADISGVNGGTGGNTTTTNGLSASRTGYLVYLVDTSGNVVSSTAAMRIEGYAGDYPGATWIAQSRKGVSVGQWESRTVPWKVPAFTSSKATNYAQIKSWMQGKDSNGVMNSVDFVEKTWTTAHAEKFLAGEYLLVLETLLHFQFQVPNGSSSTPPTVASLRLNVDELYRQKYNIPSSAMISMTYLDRLTAELNRILRETWEANGGNSSSMTPVGPPLIGTTANMVEKYVRDVARQGINWYAAYTNNVACFTMMIEPGGIGETYAKFTAWTGSTSASYRMPNPDVMKYAVGTAVFKAKSGQTTYDESQGETPAPPADESDGKYTIIKSYRKKIGTNNYEDEGTFHIKDIAPEITIENEKSHKIVEWRISTTENTGISSLTWESSVPPSVSDSGKTPTTVKLEDPEKVLYVLLERTEEEEPEVKDYNYLITQSTISRRIKISEPDNQLQMPDILNHEFKWTMPAHKTKCSGHTWSAPCDSSHTRSVKISDGCPSTCTQAHEHNGAEYGTEHYNCGQNCKTQTAYCSGWQWKNKNLKLSLHNTKQNNHPTILATKYKWFYNPNTDIAKYVQGFYKDNNTFDRETTNQITYTDNRWDYVCVIHRGQDKLNLAEWINNGEGQYDPTEAIGNLQGVNNEVYQASNKSSGARKQNGEYDETFQVSIGRQEHGTEQTDNETIYAPTIPSSVPGQSLLSSSAICPEDQRRATLTPLSFNVIVKVEVYAGEVDGGVALTNGLEEGHTSKPRIDGYANVSGRMVEGEQVSFIPYILMKYDTIDEGTTDAPAYVMGEHSRTLSTFHYGEIAWNNPSNPHNLTLTSAQWSTHATATKWLSDNGIADKNSVLPGGAALSLSIKQSDRHKVAVTSYQTVVVGLGELHVKNTTDSDVPDDLTTATAEANHQSFVSSVMAGIDATNIQQYVDDEPLSSNAFGGIEVNPDKPINLDGNSSTRTSKEDKYYFRDYDSHVASAGQGDFDVRELGTTTNYYTFYATVDGTIMAVDTTANPGVFKSGDGVHATSAEFYNLVELRTKVVESLESTLEQFTGQDDTALTGTAWYNEAFDGVTIAVSNTILEVGFIDPGERTQILDPKLIPDTVGSKSNGNVANKDMFSKYFISQFKTRSYSKAYESYEEGTMGEFRSKNVKMKDLSSFYKSKPFYIPNSTTQDLH